MNELDLVIPLGPKQNYFKFIFEKRVGNSGLIESFVTISVLSKDLPKVSLLHVFRRKLEMGMEYKKEFLWSFNTSCLQ